MFFKENNDTDLGETTIPNVFIDIYMPMANGLYVKVYLLAYRQACLLNQNHKFDNQYIAKELGIPLSDVNDAWNFWERKKIVKLHKKNNESFNYPVEFIDLRRMYLENTFTSSPKDKYNIENIVTYSREACFPDMFDKIEKIINRYLTPQEKIELINLIDNGIDFDVVVYGYDYSKKRNADIKPLSYIKTIINSWNDMNLKTVEEIENHLLTEEERYKTYKKIFNYLGFYRNPTESEKESIDTWIDNYKYDLDIILYACSKSKNSSRLSISFIEGIIEKWHKLNLKTLDEIKYHEENYNQKTYSSNNNYQNRNSKSKDKYYDMNESFNKYDSDELEKILLESQKNKFK